MVKTESLTIRLDPRTRFMLDFLGRHRDQTITKVIERAVEKFAEDTDNRVHPAGFESVTELGWRDYWHPHEGVRAIKLAVLGGLRPTAEEERLREFVRAHEPFFAQYNHYEAEDGVFDGAEYEFKNESIAVLWDRIDAFIDLWEQTRPTDRYAAGSAMRECLEAAGVPAPEWPPPAAEGGQRTEKVRLV